MIKKAAGGYMVLSEKGKNLDGPYRTKKESGEKIAAGGIFQAQEVGR